MMNSTYPAWVFDESPIDDPFGYGDRAVRFLRLLKHPASTAAGKSFQLTKWQERIVRRIYGPRNPDGTMIVKKVLLFLPRGNRKTSLAAALALLHTFGPEAQPNGQVIFAAKDSDQAKIGFEEAIGIIGEDKRLQAATRIYGAKTGKRMIDCAMKRTHLEVLSSDGGKAHGLTPTFILADELHVWKGRELWSALKSSRVKKRPLTIICTTAGAGQENLLFGEYINACKIASGEKANPSYLPILFMADELDDWEDPATWHKANPGLADGFVSIEEFEIAVADARDRPLERREFLQFNLNIWQSFSRTPLFDMAVYDGGLDPHFDLHELEELPCWLGVDLSRSGDLTAIVGAWKHSDGRISVHPWFYLPSEGLDEKARLEQVPYPRYRDEELLNVCDGPTIEPDTIADKIIDLCGTYNVQEVVFDPSLAGPIMSKLINHGIEVLQHRQSPTNMHGPICDLERVVNGRRIRHGGHPILRNHFESVVVKRATNASGLTTMHKGTRHSNHIDGAIASALAIFRAAANDNTRSIHDLDDDEYNRLMNAA